jgi:hypothetical protein
MKIPYYDVERARLNCSDEPVPLLFSSTKATAVELTFYQPGLSRICSVIAIVVKLPGSRFCNVCKLHTA